MANAERTLPVPYLTQPTPYTCQSTVLKMMAMYLEQNVVFQSTTGGSRRIVDIYKDINEGTKRPVQEKNAHANMKWWLEQHFPSLKFQYIRTTREDKAIEGIVGFIDRGYPVLVSVSHARVKGHIILVTGYANYSPGVSDPNFELVVHDPYGEFDPVLFSKEYGEGRWNRGESRLSGDEVGPGRFNRLPLEGISRRRAGDAQSGTFVLLSVAP